jgi:cytochrome c oxidase subunit 2
LAVALLTLILQTPSVSAESGNSNTTQIINNPEWNMPVGVTEISREVFSLHMIIFWICVAIAVVVFGVMFWSLIKYRHSKHHKAAHFHENTIVEVIWTAVPILILVGMAVPATATLKKMYDPSDADIDILVTGYQWRWRYEHINEEISYFSNFATPEDEIRNVAEKSDQYLLQVDNPLVVPINKKIRFLLTSNDVIHSWWVPELAVKKRCNPRFY